MSVLHLLAARDVLAAGYEIGTGRLVPTSAAAVGLAGVVLGVLAVTRAARPSAARRAVVALAAGLVSATVGGVHWANVAGGLGTGNGLAGAVMAVALGAVAVVAAGLALVRTRRAA
ncbi:DUF6223 family protein [Dactylosporangium sp. NPDC050688]|uniref:DUF6223 family protein n=1 Tax=Dactylosporangium sp. NPDC050688 TaxID=3157217 RepID=UPI0033C1C4CA